MASRCLRTMNGFYQPTALQSSYLTRLSRSTRAFSIFRTVPELRKHRRDLLFDGKTVGLVPTMGALHEGHMSLVRHAAAENDRVFVSVYVNPTQFGVNEDLDSYPKTWDSDMEKLQKLDRELESSGKGRIGAVFAPTTQTMYPTLPPDSTLPGVGSFVTITPLANLLEGKSRPVFFRGVATVCMKLFNIVEAEHVYFGQKDVQQSVIIRRLVRDFHLNTDVRVIPTERESDGMAMSSRNVYLGERRRRTGVVLSQALRAAEAAYNNGARRREDILTPAWEVVKTMQLKQDALPENERAQFDVDYISLAHPDYLEELDIVDEKLGAVLSGAIKMRPLEAVRQSDKLGLGDDKLPVRLIDNILIEAKT